MKDVKTRTLRGGFAKLLSQGFSFGVRIGSLMVLARLLEPAEFGLVAMVGAVTGVFNLLRDAGLSMATVQRPTISDEQLSTLFWINTLVGVLLAIASAAIAPGLVAFYGEPRLLWVTVAFGLGFLFNAVGVQHSALLQRHMRFGTIAVAESIALLASTAVGITMAATGFGYWALVAMALVQPAVLSAAVWIAAAWVPGPPRRGNGVLSMITYGGTITLNTLVVYVAYNMDKVLLGRVWGATPLGLYGRAYQLVNIPTENLNSAIGGVAFSALSRLQDDPPRLRSYFLKGYEITLALTLPVTVACMVFADDIVLVTLGPKWAEAALLLRLLSPTILVFSILNPLSWLMLSSNLVKRSLKIAFVIAPLVTASYALGLRHGPTGVALAFSAMMVSLAAPVAAWCVHDTPVTWRDLLEAIRVPFFSGMVATLAALLVQHWTGSSFSPVVRLALGGAALVGFYAWMSLRVMNRKGFYWDIARRLVQRTPAESAGAPAGPVPPG